MQYCTSPIKLESSTLKGCEDLVEIEDVVFHCFGRDEDVVEIGEDMLRRKASQHELHESAESAWRIFGAHRSNQIFQMHRFRRERKILAILGVHRNLPEPFCQIERRKEFRTVQLLQGVIDPRERIHYLVALLVDFAEVS